MNRYLTLSIDVEPDCTPDWTYSDPLTFEAVSKGIGEILHPLFQEYDIVPTYLINNVVLEHAPSVKCLNQLDGRFELGTHLHPEFMEPDKQFYNYAGQKGRSNCCFYPPEIERLKLKNITNLFYNCFGYNPVSFRAGRFSAGINTIKCLKELGYKVDTSVTPHVCWDNATREKPIDFRSAQEQPYFIKDGSILEADPFASLLQVPVSIDYLRRNPVKAFIRASGGLLHKINWHKRVWLRPFYSSTDEMIKLVEQYTKKYAYKESVVFNMMFHNVEVLPGLSPYTSTEKDCKNYLKQLKLFFSYCRDNGIISVSLNDLYEVYELYREKISLKEGLIA
jgi:hypothetical protein